MSLARTLVAFVALLLPALGSTAPLGIVTIVEGEVMVIRESSRMRALEGLRLHADDIVQTGTEARFARIELGTAGGGATIDLGPATKLLLQPLFAQTKAERDADVYLLEGWVKASSGASELRVASPRLDLAVLDRGSAVLHVGARSSFAFVESGAVRALERRDGKAGVAHALAEGRSWHENDGAVRAPLQRPPAQMLEQMPRAFADSLPRRAARFAAVDVEPAQHDIGYRDVAAWIDAEAALRPAFRRRWVAKARESAFRAALVAGLRAHPEWSSVLAPKPRPRRAAPAATATPAPAASAAPVHAGSGADPIPSESWATP